MKSPLLAIALTLLVVSPVNAQESTFNNVAHLAGLIHVDREPRAKKFFWIKPGKVRFWYYQWILEDGSTKTKVETHQVKQAPDLRPLRESHPNISLLLPTFQTAGNVFMGVAAIK